MDHKEWKKMIASALLGAIAILFVTQVWEMAKLLIMLDWSTVVAFLGKNPSGQALIIPLVVQIVAPIIYAIRFHGAWKHIWLALGLVSFLGMSASYLAVLSLHLFLGTAEPILSEIKEHSLTRGWMFGVIAILFLLPILIKLIITGDDVEGGAEDQKSLSQKRRH